MNNPVPCVFVVDEDNIATGLVYHFCRDTCRSLAIGDFEAGTVYGTSSDYIDEEQCNYCGEPLAKEINHEA